MPETYHAVIQEFYRTTNATSLPNDEQWEAMIQRTNTTGVVHEIAEETYEYFLGVLPPRWIDQYGFAFAEGEEPLQLFWQQGDGYRTRKLTREETGRLLDSRKPKEEGTPFDSVCEAACLILERTSDGDDLAPEHLKLLEMAVNGRLNAKGIEAFTDIYREVLSGKYRKPWLHGIEHLTRDHEGYVYWKGEHVEHWSGHLPHSEEGRREAKELARRCQIIESRGETPSVANVVWNWKE